MNATNWFVFAAIMFLVRNALRVVITKQQRKLR